MGSDDFIRPIIRVLDIGGMAWEGAEAYETVEAALKEVDAAAAR